MNWPPFKAWTCRYEVEGHSHFVAINYGGKHQDRWVLLMSVLDSSVVLKVPWLELDDLLYWECGWSPKPSKLVNNKTKIKTTNCIHLSIDSGLTIPITKDSIRPWFNTI
ncbi:TIGR02450 family Trp-rich protein [Prochlorococcus marinus]|uniref:TIGR02450 family Trp-rich protein n=1 Tax=Prochlorococcus marinus XMU1408 TaxID=2213228 RepID=A0A318R0G2_PROMR|nr:TIGR02450 family Trp-rich protein [Prochlorococcus marinus]MBW3041653.1 TIGR02450 family Trp-rich protein [Prochlorococcus marinus str. XMU1408]PYE02806.1 TIGR02450 family Trp-rich protein [Prochlorococcus marinus XMU1408]